jgi:hypothetical protein
MIYYYYWIYGLSPYNILKVRPHCSCSVSCASVNVDGFTSPSPSSAAFRKLDLFPFSSGKMLNMRTYSDPSDRKS